MFMFSVDDIIPTRDKQHNTEMRELEPILHYKMDETEAKAYKIAIIWQDECRRELPRDKYSKLNKKTDPRKTILFKYCYKLAKEMKGILEDREIPLYIRAQLQILKSIREGNIHALIEPHCLVGDKAWKRWKVWKRRQEKMLSRIPGSSESGIKAKAPKILAEMRATREFLEKKSCTELEEYELKTNEIKDWIEKGQISKYYVILSPWVRRFFGGPDRFEFDQAYHRSCITPELEGQFRIIFSNEHE